MNPLEIAMPPADPSTPRLRSADPATLAILEIGDHELFKLTYPGNTVRYSTRPGKRVGSGEMFTFNRWRRMKRDIAARRYDLVVCYSQLYAPWDPRSFGRAFMVGLPWSVQAIIRTFGVEAACRASGVPLVAINIDDSFAVNRHSFAMLDRCELYFKRELPVDGWQLFFRTAHRNLPTRRIRLNQRYGAWLDKVRPISLGLPPPALAVEPAAGEKTADVFFAGQIAPNSTVRRTGFRQIEALAARGYRVDFARDRLPYKDFLARCARAWLSWSPEGFGWDCRRHYEAAFCRSVPVMSRATIHRHSPLIEGEHGFYYDVEGDHLTRTIEHALADKARLARMAEAGRAHVLAHHTYEALCKYVVREVAEKLAGGESANAPFSG